VLIADEVGLGQDSRSRIDRFRAASQKQPGLPIFPLLCSRSPSSAMCTPKFARLGLRFRKWTSGDDADANLEDERIIASIHKAAYETNAKRVIEAPSWTY